MRKLFATLLCASSFLSAPVFAETYDCSDKQQTEELVRVSLHEEFDYGWAVHYGEGERIDDMVEYYQKQLIQTYFGWMARGGSQYSDDLIITCNGEVHYL